MPQAKSELRKTIDRWLQANNLRPVSTRYHRRRNTYRSFLATYWQGGNIVEFRATESPHWLLVDVLNTSDGTEQLVLDGRKEHVP